MLNQIFCSFQPNNIHRFRPTNKNKNQSLQTKRVKKQNRKKNIQELTGNTLVLLLIQYVWESKYKLLLQYGHSGVIYAIPD